MIHWTCHSPSPYNATLFRVISKATSGQFCVHYRQRLMSSHPWVQEMDSGYRCRYRTGFPDWELLSTSAGNTSSLHVLGGWGDFDSISLASMLLATGRPYCLWTDAPRLVAAGLREQARLALLRTMFEGAQVVMGTGKLALERLKLMGCPEAKLLDFPYVIDSAAYRCESRSYSGKIRIAACGRLENRLKGYDVALKALALLRQREPLIDFEFHVAGSGPDETALRQLVSQLDLSKHVVFRGWLQSQDIVAFMAEADVFLHPAHYEPYGVVILEALASGLPVFSTTVCGAAVDRVLPAGAGVLHAAGDVEMLAGHLAEWLASPALMSAASQSARIESLRYQPSDAVRRFLPLVHNEAFTSAY